MQISPQLLQVPACTLILETEPSNQAGAPALLLGWDPLVFACATPAHVTYSSVHLAACAE